MSKGTYWALASLAALGLGLWWYLNRAASSGSSSLGEPNVTQLNTSGWDLGSSADSVLSSVQSSLSGIGESIMNTFTPRGIRNNNPGNLDFIAPPEIPWDGQIGSDGRFGIYDTPAHGVRALSKQLQKDYADFGDNTLTGLITTWAPPTENNTQAYIDAVSGETGIDPNAQLDLYDNLPAIATAIIRQENGEVPYTAAQINQWVYS